jgi:hypothetical protein
MGQKMVCFGTRRDTRSRQDESIEAGEVGSKRPSLGGNGGHVVWWIGLIFRLLGSTHVPYIGTAKKASGTWTWRPKCRSGGWPLLGHANDKSTMESSRTAYWLARTQGRPERTQCDS